MHVRAQHLWLRLVFVHQSEFVSRLLRCRWDTLSVSEKVEFVGFFVFSWSVKACLLLVTMRSLTCVVFLPVALVHVLAHRRRGTKLAVFASRHVTQLSLVRRLKRLVGAKVLTLPVLDLLLFSFLGS